MTIPEFIWNYSIYYFFKFKKLNKILAHTVHVLQINYKCMSSNQIGSTAETKPYVNVSLSKKMLSNNEIKDDKEIESIGSGSMGGYREIDSKKLRMEIITEQIYPAYKEEITSNLTQRKVWSTMFSIFSSLTIMMVASSTIVSFSVPQFPNVHYISYLAGVLGVVALMCERFANYCSAQGSASTQRVNLLLKSIGINDELPDTITVAQPNLTSNIENHDDSNSKNLA